MRTFSAKFLCSIFRIQSKHWYGITEFFQMLMLATVVFGCKGSASARRLRKSEDVGNLHTAASDVTLFSQLEVFVNNYLKQLTTNSIPNVIFPNTVSDEDREKAIKSFQARYSKDILGKMLFVPIFGKFAKQALDKPKQDKKSKTKKIIGTTLKVLGAALKICVGVVGFQPGNLVESFKEAVEQFHSMTHVGEGGSHLYKICKELTGNISRDTQLEIVTKIGQEIRTILMQHRMQVHLHGLTKDERAAIHDVKEKSTAAIIEVLQKQDEWIKKANSGFRLAWSLLFSRQILGLSWKSDASPYESMSRHIQKLEKRVLTLERMNGIEPIIKIPDQIQVKLPRL